MFQKLSHVVSCLLLVDTTGAISCIEVIAGDTVLRKHLNPRDKPVAEFKVSGDAAITAREYCNLHGHWKA
ncbi:MAG: desulfoferrodoxin family protein [Desulfobacteraceae bacterium]